MRFISYNLGYNAKINNIVADSLCKALGEVKRPDIPDKTNNKYSEQLHVLGNLCFSSIEDRIPFNCQNSYLLN